MADPTKKTDPKAAPNKAADTKAAPTPAVKPEVNAPTKGPTQSAEQYARVRATGVERRCRGGQCFNAEGTVLARSALSDAQWREIADDEHLKVEPAKAPESPDANADAASVEQ